MRQGVTVSEKPTITVSDGWCDSHITLVTQVSVNLLSPRFLTPPPGSSPLPPLPHHPRTPSPPVPHLACCRGGSCGRASSSRARPPRPRSARRRAARTARRAPGRSRRSTNARSPAPCTASAADLHIQEDHVKALKRRHQQSSCRSSHQGPSSPWISCTDHGATPAHTCAASSVRLWISGHFVNRSGSEMQTTPVCELTALLSKKSTDF